MKIQRSGLAIDALHELLALGPAVMYVADAREPYGATYVSANVKAQMGYEAEDFIGDPNFWSSCIHPEDAPRIFEQLPGLFEIDRHTHEYRFLHKDGDYRWMHDELKLVRDADGNPEKIIGYWVNITERKLVELELEKAHEKLELRVEERTRELRHSEERFRDFVESSSDWFWEMDEHLRFTHISKGYRSSTGIDPSIYIGKTRQESTAENAKDEKWLQHFDDLENRRSFRGFAFDLDLPDGARVTARTSGKPVFDRDGVFRGYRGTGTDITEQKRAEQALHESEARLRDGEGRLKKAQKIARIGSWTWHLGDKGMIDVSGEYLRIIGFPRDQPPKNQAEYNRHIHPDDLERTLKIIDKAVNKPSDYKAEYRFVRPDGEVRYIVELGELIFDDDGLPTGHAGTIQDITERIETERQLQHALKMEAIGHLTGGIAHDFNNILTAIIGNIELTKELVDGNPNTQKCMDVALKASFRGADLTHRLLAFSRKQPLQSQATDVNGLIPGMTELMRRTLGGDIEFKSVPADDLWQAMVDGNQLENALLNLAINARDAMLEGGKLTIETANTRLDQEYADRQEEVTPGQYVMVAVSDSGSGMPPEVVERVFEPFFTTKEVGKGTGLGLSMIYGFVKQSGGHINIHSEVDQGTTVKLYLPRATGAGRSAPLADVPKRNQHRGDETILVVEDYPDIRAYVVATLEALGYHVMEAEDGPAALAMLEQVPRIDLLLTDVVLPRGMNGRQVAEEIQKRYPRVKILFTSGYSEDAILHHGTLDEGAELLAKPYTRETLAQKVRVALDAPEGLAAVADSGVNRPS